MTDTTYHRCSKFEPERPYLPSNEELMARRLEEALCDPLRDPVAEADGYRDTMPDDAADALSLARGEIAWLREAVRRLTIALEALSSPRSSTVDEATVEAVKRVGNKFHKTRLTHEVHVDPDDLYLVLKAAGYYSASLPSVAVQPIGEP